MLRRTPLLRPLVPFLALVISSAIARADIPSGSWDPPGYVKPKDFALVRDGDVYHLFYIEDFLPNDPLPPCGNNACQLGHATSTDLYNWTPQPPVLAAGQSGFTHNQVWAPSVFKHGSTWYMFYTHVVSPLLQQSIRVASSPDLYTWTPYTAFPGYSVFDIPWTWRSLTDVQGLAIRDPHVVAEYLPGTGTPYRRLMYYTTKPSIAKVSSCVGGPDNPGTTYMLGQSESDLGPPFTMENPVAFCYTHRNSPIGDHQNVLESPTILKSATMTTENPSRQIWYLAYGAGNVYADSVVCRVGYNYPQYDPLAGMPWLDHRGQLIKLSAYASDPANPNTRYFQDRYGNTVVNNISEYGGWFAPEFFDDVDGRKYFAVVHDRGHYSTEIKIRQMRWPDPTHPERFTLEQPLKFTSLQWTTAGVIAGQNAHLQISALNGASDEKGTKSCEILARASQDGGATWTEVTNASLGLPASFTLSGDNTQRSWRAGPPDGWPTDVDTWVKVRSKRTPLKETQPLVIVSDACQWPCARAHPVTMPAAAAIPAEDDLRLAASGSRPRFELRLATAGPARIQLFDIQGRLVRTLENGYRAAGVHDLVWDGRSDDGARLQHGAYFANLKTATRERAVKLLLTP